MKTLKYFNQISTTRKRRVETCLNGKYPYKLMLYKKKINALVNEDNSVLNRILPRKQPGLYMIRCIENDWRYYGESKNISGRLASHKSLLNRKIHPNQLLQNDWNKYGMKNFDFIILFMGSKWELQHVRRKKELELILFDSDIVYNIYEGVSNPKEKNPFWKRIHTPETKQKISEALKDRPNHLLGKKISIHNIEYPSIAEASRQTGEARKTIRRKIEDSNNLNYLEKSIEKN